MWSRLSYNAASARQQLNEAEVNVDKAKLALAVLIFQDLHAAL